MITGTIDTNWSEAKKARVKAANVKRRLIFNDDTYELSRDDANTVDGFLQRRLKPLVGSQVDTIAWSVLGGWADAPVYDSKVQPIYGDAHGGPPPYWTAVPENVKTLIKAGNCPLQVVIDFGRENGMETFASIRTNDVHDCFIPGGITIWKRQHPEFLVDTKGTPAHLDLYHTSQDFSHKEVRGRKFEIIEEICSRYDIDGFELDFIRHPVFFSRTMRNLPVTEAEVDIMTSFMRRIRQITDEAGERRGRPVLLATRVPDTFEFSKNVGLDIKRWMEEDLVDIMIAGGGYAPFTMAVEDFTKEADRHGVLVYPCINNGAADTVSEGEFLECVRALATNWYEAGADGAYLWNFGSPFEYKSGDELIAIRDRYYAPLAEIGERETLAGKDKNFYIDNGGGNVFSYYTHVTNRPPLPLTSKQGRIKRGVTGRLPLVVEEDVQGRIEDGSIRETLLTIKIRGPVEEEALSLQLNGETLTGGELVESNAGKLEFEISYPVNAPPLKKGKNFIEIYHQGDPSATLEFYSVKLGVKYKGNR